MRVSSVQTFDTSHRHKEPRVEVESFIDSVEVVEEDGHFVHKVKRIKLSDDKTRENLAASDFSLDAVIANDAVSELKEKRLSSSNFDNVDKIDDVMADVESIKQSVSNE